MKYFAFFIISILNFYIVFAQTNEAEYNYANGNGTILRQYTENGNQITIRKHEQCFSTLVNPSFVDSSFVRYGVDELTAYETPYKNSREVFKLKYGDTVNTLQVAYVKNISTGSVTNWVQIRNDNNIIGWIDMDTPENVYKNGTWSIMERITVNAKSWTVRKIDQLVSVQETLNVRNNPGVNGTNILFRLMPSQSANPLITVTVLAITEETDTIDGITDYWLKIKNDNRTGWIFGGYTGVERGGPKYYIPSWLVDSYINYNFRSP